MKIFVSIASYCDELLFFTINDCLSKAKHPENIIFAIVDQNENSQKDKIDKLDFCNQIRYVYINKLDTFGVSWARNIAFSLLDNEEYLLQIDSHMFQMLYGLGAIRSLDEFVKFSKIDYKNKVIASS